MRSGSLQRARQVQQQQQRRPSSQERVWRRQRRQPARTQRWWLRRWQSLSLRQRPLRARAPRRRR